MKTPPFHLFLFVIFLFISCTDVVYDHADHQIDIRSSVTPELVEGWQSGDAAFECEQAGAACNFAWKVDDNAPNGTYDTTEDPDEYDNTPLNFDANIVIHNSDGYTFSWTSDYKVCAVIVKGGQDAHIYTYDEWVCDDTDLVAPINPNSGTNYEISHVTFCFGNELCDDPIEVCYEEETAWADGDRYTRRGNWATYVCYDEDLGDDDYPTLEVDLIAGKKHVAGTVTLSSTDGSEVDILIEMDDGWIFYYDLADDEEDDNVKVQDYAEAPSGNPAPGLFDWKETADVNSSSYTITVPYNSYYGIHVDVAKEVDCE